MPAIAQVRYGGFLSSLIGAVVSDKDVVEVILDEFIAVIGVSSCGHPIDCQDSILVNWTLDIFREPLAISCVRPS